MRGDNIESINVGTKKSHGPSYSLGLTSSGGPTPQSTVDDLQESLYYSLSNYVRQFQLLSGHSMSSGPISVTIPADYLQF